MAPGGEGSDVRRRQRLKGGRLASSVSSRTQTTSSNSSRQESSEDSHECLSETYQDFVGRGATPDVSLQQVLSGAKLVDGVVSRRLSIYELFPKGSSGRAAASEIVA